MKAFLLIFLYFLLKLTNFLWFIGNKKIPNKLNASEWLHSKYSNFRNSHWRCSSKSVFLTKQNRCSHRKAPVLESRYNIFAGLKKTLSQFFSYKICESFKTPFFTEHLFYRTPSDNCFCHNNWNRQKQPPEVFRKKRCSCKFRKIHRKTPEPESLF